MVSDDSSGGVPQPGARRTMGSQQMAMRVMHRKSVGIVAVYEQDLPEPESGGRALVFESAAACTRVAEFPKDWRKLSDEELAAMRRRAS